MDEGHIAITLKETAHELRLAVTNDGTPLSVDFDLKGTDSLGLQIVDSLVRGDLQGKFPLTTHAGLTSAAVVFAK